MKRTQIYLKPSQIENLKKYAERRDISMSEAIRQLIDNFFTKNKKETSGFDDVLKVSEENKVKGPKDLAEKHDEYIYHKD